MSNERINGFVFHQYALNQLKSEVESNRIHASAVACYIGLTSEVSPSGLLPVDFKKSDLASKLNMSRQTVNDGYSQLVESGLISEVTIDEVKQIELAGYSMHNLDMKESSVLKNKLSYFHVASELFNTAVIADLVKSREAKGLLLLLDLFNHFSRELNIKNKKAADAPDQLTVRYLKSYLGKSSASRVRSVIDMMDPLFSFVPDKLHTREPKKVNPIRAIVSQIWVNKYFIHINPTCLAEKEATTVEKIEAAKALKDAHYKIKYMNLALKQSDKNGIGIAYRASVREVARFIADVKDQAFLLRDSMQYALEELETYAKNNTISSIGAFINTKLQNYVIGFLKKNEDVSLDIVSHYNATGSAVPNIIQRYFDSQNK